MKPDAAVPSFTPELTPVVGRVESEPVVGFYSPEADPTVQAESGAERSELGAVAADVASITALPTPVVDDNVVADTTVVAAVGGAPLIAKDEDLIEKEWVDKAKKIVAQTQSNPHQREQEVSKLQVDYLKKRFGRELGPAE